MCTIRLKFFVFTKIWVQLVLKKYKIKSIFFWHLSNKKKKKKKTKDKFYLKFNIFLFLVAYTVKINTPKTFIFSNIFKIFWH